uniref:Heat shock protein DnaJ domain protein n=1 Tax=Cyanothece sp. (strain PCC 7425 / ATCC 29141) TaxID=395961 RepID=B8HYG8_CYAP4
MGKQKQLITTRIETEIKRLASEYGYSSDVLKSFALFVLEKETNKSRSNQLKKTKKLTLTQLKEAIYKHFSVKDTKQLKVSGAFQLATSGMGKVNLSSKEDWEQLYRKLIGILPGEEDEKGYGCVNGINIFKYDMPWKAFGLDSKKSTTDDVKVAYRNLSKIYHPDIPNTGDAAIFERLTVFYKSLTEKF